MTMAVKVESFLVIEDSLTDKLTVSWRRSVAPILNRIQRAVAIQDFTEAYELVNLITMAGISTKNDKFIKLAGMSSVLFGASQLTSPRKSSFTETGQPQAVDDSTELMEMGLASSGTEQVRTRARNLIANEEELQREESQTVAKAASATFTQTFKSSMNAAGESQINIASSLHTSRLAQFGFLTEAQFTGVQSYEVSEQLDGRTCPVCREMDGKVFPVSSAKAKVDRQLSVENPADLKIIAPFPRQDKNSVDALSKMSTAQLVGAGLDTPPYHPRCRGILVASNVPADINMTPEELPPEIVRAIDIKNQSAFIELDDDNPFTDQQLEDHWAELIGTTSPQDIADRMERMSKIAGSKVIYKMEFDEFDGDQFFGAIMVKRPGDGVSMFRALQISEGGTKDILHSSFIIPAGQQGKGIAKAMLKEQMAMYRKIGVENVELTANISVGGYAWARYGFAPDSAQTLGRIKKTIETNVSGLGLKQNIQDEITAILDRNDPELLWDIADIRTPITIDLPDGARQTLPLGRHLLLGSNWHGILSLDDAAAMKRFDSYIGE